jgi:hypothetical protein
MRAFCEAWGARYGRPYLPTPADCNQLRLLVGSTPLAVIAELPAIFERYLDDLDQFVAQRQRHSLKFFCTSGGLNTYTTSAPVLSRKEVAGMEAGRQFINGEGSHAGKR